MSGKKGKVWRGVRGETDVVCLFCKDRLKEAAAAVFLPTEQGQRKGGAGAGGGGVLPGMGLQNDGLSRGFCAGSDSAKTAS